MVSLVADTDAGNLLRQHFCLVQEFPCCSQDIPVNILHVVGNPPPVIDNLRVGNVAAGKEFPIPIKQESFRTLGTLVNSDYTFFVHNVFLYKKFDFPFQRKHVDLFPCFPPPSIIYHLRKLAHSVLRHAAMAKLCSGNCVNLPNVCL